jgi:hypothetical protein
MSFKDFAIGTNPDILAAGHRFCWWRVMLATEDRLEGLR